jgi:excisionase family DNA binding protein
MKHGLSNPTLCKLWDAERELGVSRVTLYRWCRRGLVQFTRLPSGHIRIPVSELERLKNRSSN